MLMAIPTTTHAVMRFADGPGRGRRSCPGADSANGWPGCGTGATNVQASNPETSGHDHEFLGAVTLRHPCARDASGAVEGPGE